MHLHGNIINGHEVRFRHAQDSIPILRHQLANSDGLNFFQKRRLKERIAALLQVAIYHQLTQELLERLKAISPVLYREMSDLRDRNGKPTDIYVRLIPSRASRIPFPAASILSSPGGDRDTPRSAYGSNSVAVDLWVSERALLMLSHELGHLSYIVPNLAQYADYYRERYRLSKRTGRIGHLSTDESGRLARVFEKRYIADYRAYVARSGRPQTILSTLNRITRDLREWPPPEPVPIPWYELPDITTNR